VTVPPLHQSYKQVHRLVTPQEQILMLLGAMIYKVNETFLGVTLPGRSPSACQDYYATRLTIAIRKVILRTGTLFFGGNRQSGSKSHD
jgi:hypothetical protein